MQVGERTHTDRKPAGASLLSRIRIAEKEKRAGRSVLGAIGGFGLGMEVERFGREKGVGEIDGDEARRRLNNRLAAERADASKVA